jgi:HKD family nuclease
MIARNTLPTNTDIKLLSCLKDSIRNSNKIKILAAFIMEAGTRLILDDLIYAARKGVQI